jgi:hypothetical protein
MPEFGATALAVIKRTVLGMFHSNGNPYFQIVEDGDQLWIGLLESDEARRPLVREVASIEEAVAVRATDAVVV